MLTKRSYTLEQICNLKAACLFKSVTFLLPRGIIKLLMSLKTYTFMDDIYSAFNDNFVFKSLVLIFNICIFCVYADFIYISY